MKMNGEMMKIRYGLKELKKMLKHAQDQHQKSLNPTDKQIWKTRIKEINRLLANTKTH